MSNRTKRMRELGLLPEKVSSNSNSSFSDGGIRKKKILLSNMKVHKHDDRLIYFIGFLFVLIIGLYVCFKEWEFFLGLLLLPLLFVVEPKQSGIQRKDDINFEAYLISYSRFKKLSVGIRCFEDLLLKIDENILFLFGVKDKLFVEDFWLLKSLLEQDLLRLFDSYVFKKENESSFIELLEKINEKFENMKLSFLDKDFKYKVIVKKIGEKLDG